MTQTQIKRRFIAGAVCPQCQQLDKTVMYTENDILVRECIQCGFRDLMTDEKPLVMQDNTQR